VRRKLKAIYNKKEADFATLELFNDYEVRSGDRVFTEFMSLSLSLLLLPLLLLLLIWRLLSLLAFLRDSLAWY
jgi:hypothetical protein